MAMRISSRNENTNHPFPTLARGRVFCIRGIAGRGRSEAGGPRVLPRTDRGGPDCELHGSANSLPKPSGSFPASAPCPSRVSPPETRLFLATLSGRLRPRNPVGRPARSRPMGETYGDGPRARGGITLRFFGGVRGACLSRQPTRRHTVRSPTHARPQNSAAFFRCRGGVCRKRLPREKNPRYFRASSCRVSDHFWGKYLRGFGNRLAICRPIGKGGRSKEGSERPCSSA